MLIAHLSKISQLIREGLEKLEPGEETESINRNFQNILAHIQQAKRKEPLTLAFMLD